MSAARGTLPFTWKVKRQSGVFLLGAYHIGAGRGA